jgi:hypothetical protein
MAETAETHSAFVVDVVTSMGGEGGSVAWKFMLGVRSARTWTSLSLSHRGCSKHLGWLPK